MKVRLGYHILFRITALILLVGFFVGCMEEGESTVHPAHWDYETSDWQSLGYTDCAGTVQTPINIETAATVLADLGELNFNYNPFNMSIVDNGHTVQVNKGSTSVNILEVDGVTFDFLQFHYHTHSEHAIDGGYIEMEIHLVHQDPITKNLAVVAVFLDGHGTTDHPFIEKYLSNFPAEQLKEVATTVDMDLNDLLPSSHKYYTYTGSLTTPPCSQGLKWIVLKEVAEASPSQIHAFEERHEVNARDLQPLNNRIVLEQK